MKLNQYQKISKKQKSRTRYLPGELFQTFREQLMPVSLKHFQKTKEEGRLPNTFYEACITLIQKQTKTSQKKKRKGQNL